MNVLLITAKECQVPRKSDFRARVRSVPSKRRMNFRNVRRFFSQEEVHRTREFTENPSSSPRCNVSCPTSDVV